MKFITGTYLNNTESIKDLLMPVSLNLHVKANLRNSCFVVYFVNIEIRIPLKKVVWIWRIE
jgi:hypothetical protein